MSFCVVLFVFMIVATTSLQTTHFESHKNTIKGYELDTNSIGLMVITNTVTSWDDSSSQISFISELTDQLTFALVTKHQNLNVPDLKSYFLLYSEFNSLAIAALISYLYQKSLP